MSQSYAGFISRIKAFSADYLLISLYLAFLVAISLLIQSYDPGILLPLFGNPWSGQLSGFVLITLPVTLYFAISESSSRLSTWGKRWQGIIVVDTNGKRLSRWQALGRTALKFVPWELSHTYIWQVSYNNTEQSPLILFMLILVWILIGIYVLTLLLSSKNQTLYDQIASTLVIKKDIHSNHPNS